MYDTHCHLTYKGLIERIDDVLAAARAVGVERMVSVGTTPRDAAAAVELSERFDAVYATVGLHPHYAADWADRDVIQNAMRQLAEHPRVVAFGEMGLDQHYPEPALDLQQQALGWQLEVAAARTDLPIIIHNREATDLTLAALRASGIEPSRFVFHCFTGSRAELDAVLDFGAMVSFTGIVTFSSARDLAEASDTVPLDRLMIETDSPYLTPEPYRKVRPNEPRYVADVARFLAARRSMNVQAFTDAVDANTRQFFRFGA